MMIDNTEFAKDPEVNCDSPIEGLGKEKMLHNKNLDFVTQ